MRSYAAPHAGRPVVLRLDLEAFFASVTRGPRVYGIWRSAGYPEPVAHCLAGLMTTVLPLSVLARRAPARGIDASSTPTGGWAAGSPRRTCPQGAPTSPALANLAAFRPRRTPHRAARRPGAVATPATPTTSPSPATAAGAPGTSRLLDTIDEIVRDEGFRLNQRKTGVMPRAGRQTLGGLVVNDRPRVARREVDQLRAILHNCGRYGPSTQNREAHPAFEEHLRGRIAWVAQHDPVRGARLLADHDAIDWTR